MEVTSHPLSFRWDCFQVESMQVLSWLFRFIVRLSSQRNSLQDQRNRPLDWVGLEGDPNSGSPNGLWVRSRQSFLVFWYKYMHFVSFDSSLLSPPISVRKSSISCFIFVSLIQYVYVWSRILVSLQRFCCYHVRVISDKTESKVSLFVHCFLLNAHSFIFLLNALSHVFFIFLN